MTNRKTDFPHTLRHVQTGKWLQLWIDGWHLVDNKDHATGFSCLEKINIKIMPEVEYIFGKFTVHSKEQLPLAQSA